MIVSRVIGMPELIYVGSRKAMKNGDSTAVSLPKRELRRVGVDVEELQGELLNCRLEGSEFIIDLPIED
jgi:hypothetical protein